MGGWVGGGGARMCVQSTDLVGRLYEVRFSEGPRDVCAFKPALRQPQSPGYKAAASTTKVSTPSTSLSA